MCVLLRRARARLDTVWQARQAGASCGIVGHGTAGSAR
nr:MAG TPA: hypothetical protein [Caudoviricetes sp.]